MDNINLNIKDSNLDLSALENLSPAEKELVFSILQEYSETGSSKQLNDILLEDYAEVPVDILTFVDDYNYLGNAWHDAEGKSKLYPYWRKELIKIFPDNLTTTVNNGIFSGSRGRGKAQPLDALLYSENGYIKMRDVKIGTQLYGSDGKLHKVLGIFPQGRKPIYKVTFSDGTSTLCSDEHLWTVKDVEKQNNLVTLSVQDMLKTGIYREASHSFNESRYGIPLCEPLTFAHTDTLIDPYIFGCLLGDGCFSICISLTSADKEILEAFNTEIQKYSYELSPNDASNNCKSFYIKNKNKSERKNIYLDEIKRLGLYKHTSELKFIPNVYKYNDINSRIALLQGLLDTDGEITQNGDIAYSTVSKQLANDIIFLVQSLGGTAKLRIKTNRRYKYKGEYKPCKDVYIIAIKLPKDIQPCRLHRKLIRLKTTRLEPFRKIKSIDYVEDQECQCIYVDAEDHLYLTNDLILTHNTEIAVLIASYLLHRVLCLKDPVAHFRLKPTEKLVFAFMNIKLALAEEIGIAKFQNTIQSSPWFMDHGELEGRTRKLWVPKKFNDQQAIDIKVGSQADDLIGLPIYFAFFDEVSFQRNQDVEKQKQKANDMIDTAIGGMKTRFVHKGKNPTFLALASSKRSDKSFLEEHMKKKLKSEKDNVYISDGSVWEVKPEGTYSDKTFRVGLGNKFLQSIVIPDDDDSEPYIAKGYKIIEVPIDFKADFLDDIDRALCDFAGISSSSITKYISAAAFYDLVTDRIKNPFTREILEIGNAPDDDAQYYDFFDITKIDPALRSKPLFIHMDMSVSGDKTGIAGVFIRGKKPSINPDLQSNDLFYSLAFSVSIKAPKGRQISFEKNRNFIRWLRRVGFNIKGISTDSYQSYDTGQALLSEGFPYTMLSVDKIAPTERICIPYQYLKTTIYEKRLEIYDDRVLKSEVTELERNLDTGKVDHPGGGCFTGETKVSLVDGRNLTFLELIDEYNQGKVNYVYSINLNSKKIEPKPIVKAWKTKENAKLVRITLDNDQVIECTLDHRFMLRDGTYIEAQELLPNDSLMPLYTKYPTKGALEDYRMYYEPFEDQWHFEHRSFASDILDEHYLVHHINCNKHDNRPCNLIWMSKAKHRKKPQYRNRYRQKFYDLINHKVTAIKFIDKTADVYDIEVEDNHNFALAAGIFVHNSKDKSDALCGSIYNASKHAEEFAYDYGESSEELLRINSESSYEDAHQIALNLEEELKKMNGIMRFSSNNSLVHPSDLNIKTSQYSMFDDIIIL